MYNALSNIDSIFFYFSGRCPNGLTLDLLEKQGYTEDNLFPTNHGHAVSVPGAAAAWVDTVERFGSGKVNIYLEQSNYILDSRLKKIMLIFSSYRYLTLCPFRDNWLCH